MKREMALAHAPPPHPPPPPPPPPTHTHRARERESHRRGLRGRARPVTSPESLTHRAFCQLRRRSLEGSPGCRCRSCSREGHRDVRETQSCREMKSERQSDREAEIQRDRETERDGETDIYCPEKCTLGLTTASSGS
eukprot:COSAG03_NODE_2592_length_2611_cov_11.720541_4_plen_137_part_00